MLGGIFGTVYDHSEASVDHLAPSDASSVVDGDPCGSSEGVADDILDSHIGREPRPIVDVGRLPEWGISSGDVMMIPTQDYRA